MIQSDLLIRNRSIDTKKDNNNIILFPEWKWKDPGEPLGLIIAKAWKKGRSLHIMKINDNTLEDLIQ